MDYGYLLTKVHFKMFKKMQLENQYDCILWEWFYCETRADFAAILVWNICVHNGLFNVYANLTSVGHYSGPLYHCFVVILQYWGCNITQENMANI